MKKARILRSNRYAIENNLLLFMKQHNKGIVTAVVTAGLLLHRLLLDF